MNAAQKHAWFNLAVIAATFLTVLALIPVLASEPWAASDCWGCWGSAPCSFGAGEAVSSWTSGTS